MWLALSFLNAIKQTRRWVWLLLRLRSRSEGCLSVILPILPKGPSSLRWQKTSIVNLFCLVVFKTCQWTSIVRSDHKALTYVTHIFSRRLFALSDPSPYPLPSFHWQLFSILLAVPHTSRESGFDQGMTYGSKVIIAFIYGLAFQRFLFLTVVLPVVSYYE